MWNDQCKSTLWLFKKPLEYLKIIRRFKWRLCCFSGSRYDTRFISQTDTSGSIRVPSSLCGVVGLKPTYGRVSKYGIVDLAPSLDHVGCITRSAWDAAAVLQTISGKDPLDPTTEVKETPNYTEIAESERTRSKKNFSVGIPKDYFFDYLQPEVQKSVL